MPDITMATQVMTMDNGVENAASKLAEVSLNSPDSNNNKGVESGDAGASPVKVQNDLKRIQ